MHFDHITMQKWLTDTFKSVENVFLIPIIIIAKQVDNNPLSVKQRFTTTVSNKNLKQYQGILPAIHTMIIHLSSDR